MLRKRKNWDSQERNMNQYDFDFEEVENTPPKKKRATENTGRLSVTAAVDSPVTSQSDSEGEEEIAVKSFYGKREKKSFPHSPKRRKAVKKVLKKLSDEENISQGESQASDSMPDTKKTEKTVLRPRARKGVKPATPSIQKNNTSKSNSHGTPTVQTIKSPRTPIVQAKINSPLKPSTPGSGEKRFFKHRCPGSAEKYIPGVVIRKGFDIKFTPNRKDIVLGKKKEGSNKTKAKKTAWPLTPFPKGKTKNAKKAGLTVKNNVRHSYPLADPRRMFSQEISPALSQRESESSNKTGSPNSVSSSQSVVDSVHSGPSIRIRAKTQTSEPAPQPLDSDSDTNTSASITTEDKTLLSTDNVMCNGDTISDVMEGIQPIETVDTEGEGSPKEPNNITNTEQEETRSSRCTGSHTASSTASPQQKLFPIFNKVTPSPKSRLRTLRDTRSRSVSKSPKLRFIENKDDQMTLDAGQKKFGATQCDTCGMIYSQAEPTDETTHAKFHQSILNALKFPGWKKERVVQEYDDGSRVVMVTYEDPKYAHKKVEEINKIMGGELGFPESTFIFRTDYKVFLMISDDKKIIGCCLAENTTQGNRVIADSQSSQESGSRPWYCDSEPEPASVGISKIWVHKLHRRTGIACKLLDCVRQNFHYGTFIPKKRIAFSDPTPDGKKLATKYIGTSSFLVYKFG